MRWPDEIRDPAELLPPPVDVSDEEIDGALALMDTMTRDDLEGDEFQDQYTEARRRSSRRSERPSRCWRCPSRSSPAQVLDIMAALNESVQKAKASRGEAADGADVHELTKPNKKAAVKKQPAKKTAAKKTPAREATAKKTSGRRPRNV